MKLPGIGTSLPRSRNILKRILGRSVLKISGWRLEGSLPDLPKFVLIGAPHTSNWDFVLVMAVVFALGIEMHWMGKHTLFRPSYGWFMRLLGGLPVDRSRRQGLVEQMVDYFEKNDRFILCITPEGTRKEVTAWKTGFYFIAAGANVPIVPAKLDLQRKVVVLNPPVYPSGDVEKDLNKLRDLYRAVER